MKVKFLLMAEVEVEHPNMSTPADQGIVAAQIDGVLDSVRQRMANNEIDDLTLYRIGRIADYEQFGKGIDKVVKIKD